MESKILEINLISAQNLKPPSANIRRMQTYAIVHIGSSTKLRTRIDRLGFENPTWNDKFLFKASQDFLSSETAGVDFEIYAVGCIRDSLIGTVRFLVSSLSLYNSCSSQATSSADPSIIALQIRRPSGRCQGVLNVAIAVVDLDLAALNGASAIGYKELMGDSLRRRRKPPRDLKRAVSMPVVEELCMENFCSGDSGEFSDGGDSTTSSSSTASTVLKDLNVIRDLVANSHVRSQSDGGGLLCGLLLNRRLSLCLSDQNLNVYGGDEKENE